MAVTDILTVIIIGFILVIMSGAFIYSQAQVETEFENLEGTTSTGENYSTLILDSFKHVGDAYSVLLWATGFILIIMFLEVLISAYMVDAHPIFFIVHFLISPFMIIGAVAVSNAYEEIATSTQLASTFASFTLAGWIMNYLPHITIVIFLMGGVLMVMRWSRNYV